MLFISVEWSLPLLPVFSVPGGGISCICSAGYQAASDPCDSLVGHGESDDQNAVIWSRDFRVEIGEITRKLEF